MRDHLAGQAVFLADRRVQVHARAADAGLGLGAKLALALSAKGIADVAEKGGGKLHFALFLVSYDALLGTAHIYYIFSNVNIFHCIDRNYIYIRNNFFVTTPF